MAKVKTPGIQLADKTAIKRLVTQGLEYGDIYWNFNEKYTNEMFLAFFVETYKKLKPEEENLKNKYLGHVNHILKNYRSFINIQKYGINENEDGKFEITDEVKPEASQEDLNKEITDLNNRITELQNQLDEKEKEIKRLTNNINEARNNESVARDAKDKAVREKQELEKRINTLETVQTKLSDLQKEYENLKQELETTKSQLKRANTLYNDLKAKTSQAKLQEAELDKQIADEYRSQQKLGEIADRIINFIIPGIYLSKLTKKLPNQSSKDFRASFSMAQSKANICVTSMNEFDPFFSVCPYGQFDTFPIKLPNSQTIDIVLTSDYHVRALGNNDNFYGNYNALKEYCEQNNIHYIINAGDFFQFTESKSDIDYKLFSQSRSTMEEAIWRIPIIGDGTKQIVIGGNHDKDNLRLGFDPLKEFVNNRKAFDFIHIGHEDGIVKLISPDDNELLKLVLRHGNEQLKRDKLSKKTKNLDDNSILFLGHSHEGYYDPKTSVFVLPSLTSDRYQNGALQMRIRLSDNGLIESIEYYPLAIEEPCLDRGRRLSRGITLKG